MRTRALLITAFLGSFLLAQDTVVVDNAYYHNKALEAVDQLDTSGLNAFWMRFQVAVDADDRTQVVGVLSYPVHEILVHEWNYSITCDTAFFASHFDEFWDTDITSENALARYDFLFTKELKSIIQRTDLERILHKGSVWKDGIDLRLFAKDYGMGCGSDIALPFYLHRTPSGWRLQIGQ
jgi:hypothetical protein